MMEGPAVRPQQKARADKNLQCSKNAKQWFFGSYTATFPRSNVSWKVFENRPKNRQNAWKSQLWGKRNSCTAVLAISIFTFFQPHMLRNFKKRDLKWTQNVQNHWRWKLCKVSKAWFFFLITPFITLRFHDYTAKKQGKMLDNYSEQKLLFLLK